jgi:hypothetical protein
MGGTAYGRGLRRSRMARFPNSSKAWDFHPPIWDPRPTDRGSPLYGPLKQFFCSSSEEFQSKVLKSDIALEINFQVWRETPHLSGILEVWQESLPKGHLRSQRWLMRRFSSGDHDVERSSKRRSGRTGTAKSSSTVLPTSTLWLAMRTMAGCSDTTTVTIITIGTFVARLRPWTLRTMKPCPLVSCGSNGLVEEGR